jgi:hypothetical protein
MPDGRFLVPPMIVMAGLDPAIRVVVSERRAACDARFKSGHDGLLEPDW